MNLAVLMACHDRAATTLACLDRLDAALRREPGLYAKVFLVDDGSSDGTGALVRSRFPDARVIDADGSLDGAKGMRLAWETALAEGAGWNAYLWLNDDAMLFPEAAALLLGACRASSGAAVVVGDLRGADGAKTYGLAEDGLFTGNVVLVPEAVRRRVGMIDGGFSHGWADLDYAQRTRRAGVAAVSAGFLGTCESHPLRPHVAGRSLAERRRLLADPKGWALRDVWRYRRRHFGLLPAALSCAHVALHVLFAKE